MTDICRLCASLKILDHLTVMGEPNLQLREKLSRCCSIELPSNDELMPQSVCRECISSLNTSWNFAEKVFQAQEILKKAFNIVTLKNAETEDQGNAFDGRHSRNKLRAFDQVPVL